MSISQNNYKSIYRKDVKKLIDATKTNINSTVHEISLHSCDFKNITRLKIFYKFVCQESN